MKNDETKHYSEDTQRLLLQFMISDPMVFARSQNIINPKYWSDRLRASCRFIMDYAEAYTVLPTTEQIKAETGVEIESIPADEATRHSEWYLETVEEFCRHKAMEQLILDGPELILHGRYSEIESRTKENMLISLQKDLGTDYFLNPQERLQAMKDRTGMTSTGWKDIDSKLYGGFNRGELSFFAGGPGTGKSLFLQNLALNWVQLGLNIVYITLELSEHLVGLRFDAMITETPTKQIFKQLDETALKVMMAKKASKWGKLQIKKLPEAGTKVNDIRAYLKEFEIQTDEKVDGICVDYLDLLHPNSGKVGPSDLFVKDKYTSEELRALAAEFNILAATASQLNRASIQEQDFDPSHIAGGISKINTADNVMGIYVSPQMKELGEYQIQFLKTRSSSGVGQRVRLKFNVESLRIIDHDDGENTTASSPLSSIGRELAQGKATSKVVPNTSATPTASAALTSNTSGGTPPAPAVVGLKNRMAGMKRFSE